MKGRRTQGFQPIGKIAAQVVEDLAYRHKVERLRVDKAAEESFNRKLRLDLETLRRPQYVESFAVKQLRMIAPTSADTLVIERTTASVPGRAIIASNR